MTKLATLPNATGRTTSASAFARDTSAICLRVLILIAPFFSLGASAEVARITESPRPFLVSPPAQWVVLQPTRQSTRARYASPAGSPSAECAVTVKEYAGLAQQSQNQLDQSMMALPSSKELTSQFSAQYNNVRIFSIGHKWVSGFAGQIFNYQHSVGTTTGELWSRGISLTFATTPGFVWVVGCGGTGFSPADAERNYSYWQSDILNFLSSIRIQ
jgi:hypothetical protein